MSILAGRNGRSSVMAGVVALGLLALAPALAADSPFGGLTGSWGGNGVIKYTDGSTERMRCNARYSGAAADLSMSINCSSSSRSINVSGHLHSNGGRVSGDWAESNLGLSGSASGRVAPGRLSLGLGGSVAGSMLVSYSGSHQDISISVQGAALQSVTMSMGKR